MNIKITIRLVMWTSPLFGLDFPATSLSDCLGRRCRARRTMRYNRFSATVPCQSPFPFAIGRLCQLTEILLESIANPSRVVIWCVSCARGNARQSFFPIAIMAANVFRWSPPNGIGTTWNEPCVPGRQSSFRNGNDPTIRLVSSVSAES